MQVNIQYNIMENDSFRWVRVDLLPTIGFTKNGKMYNEDCTTYSIELSFLIWHVSINFWSNHE